MEFLSTPLSLPQPSAPSSFSVIPETAESGSSPLPLLPTPSSCPWSPLARLSETCGDLPDFDPRLSKARLIRLARERVEELTTQCFFARDKNKILKNQLKGAANKKQCQVIKKPMTHMTGDEAEAFWKEQERENAVRAAEVTRKAQAQSNKRVENECRRAQFIQLDAALHFTKPLSQYRRADLEDIVIILGMTVDAKKDTVNYHTYQLCYQIPLLTGIQPIQSIVTHYELHRTGTVRMAPVRQNL
ncbi:hypothetical protein BC629DRAFT_1439911 [Irpex lacteus]|nr:hypothetical protein BC629DRAFT_1439911 [Irpex lacteus]